MVSYLIVSGLFGALGSWFMSRYAYRFGLLDIPNNRSSHILPTPRGGGIGILAAFVVSSLLLQLPLLIWLPAVLLAIVSFFDDKLGLTPTTRLLFQFAAALFVAGTIFSALDVLSIQNLKFITQNLTLLFLSSIFIVGTANFYNFMDGINGIAGITGFVAFCLLGFFASNFAQQPVISFSAYGVAAACIGFLPFNMPKARVFMGDVGSILLGFVFASCLTLLVHSLADFLVLAGFLSTFYIDALTTLFIRKRDGERLSQAHRRHLYQLFTNQLQISHWKVSLCYGAVQLLIGLLLLAIYPYGSGVIIGAVIILVVLWIFVMRKVRRRVEVKQA